MTAKIRCCINGSADVLVGIGDEKADEDVGAPRVGYRETCPGLAQHNLENFFQNGMMKFRYLTAWFVLLVVAVINGGLRDLTYGKHLPAVAGEPAFLRERHRVCSGVVIHQYVRRWPPASAREAWYIGLFWMALTVAFEFLFFHYVGGHPWAELLANYDMAKGVCGR